MLELQLQDVLDFRPSGNIVSIKIAGDDFCRTRGESLVNASQTDENTVPSGCTCCDFVGRVTLQTPDKRRVCGAGLLSANNEE
jgi:hypothetical protein